MFKIQFKRDEYKNAEVHLHCALITTAGYECKMTGLDCALRSRYTQHKDEMENLKYTSSECTVIRKILKRRFTADNFNSRQIFKNLHGNLLLIGDSRKPIWFMRFDDRTEKKT